MLRNFDLDKTLTVRQVLDIIESLGISDQPRECTIENASELDSYPGKYHGVEVWGLTLRDFETAILEEL